ncbi:PilZ domain-containing protein [Sphingosinicella sp. CPCC 101087]|uniref:PilZ domain-containing protein n=1 Tax=Sphingosinicella sp. CPCC 101087 TaxID=2497754 RepID=UPI0013ED6FB1|nr:PilZ domain-containing protein [Sphingosinicella sp. CPCC 101087]
MNRKPLTWENAASRCHQGVRVAEVRTLFETVYSLSGDVPLVEAADEEADPSVLQPGAIVAGSIRQVCLIRKISAGGAILHADIPVEEGRRLELELETGEHLDGRIVWQRGSELGLRFDEAIDVLPILAHNLVSQPGERRRMPRVEVSCPARLEMGPRNLLVTVHDISQGGAKIETPFPLEVDRDIVLSPERLQPLTGRTVWVDGCVAGVSFEPELDWQALMPWLRSRRDAPLLPPAAPAPPEPESTRTSRSVDSGSVQMNLPARVREGTRRWSIDVTALTSRTVEFDCFAALRLGSLLWIVLPGLEGWPARIVGIDGYRFTCEFTQPLHPAVLERILAQSVPA